MIGAVSHSNRMKNDVIPCTVSARAQETVRHRQVETNQVYCNSSESLQKLHRLVPRPMPDRVGPFPSLQLDDSFRRPHSFHGRLAARPCGEKYVGTTPVKVRQPLCKRVRATPRPLDPLQICHTYPCRFCGLFQRQASSLAGCSSGLCHRRSARYFWHAIRMISERLFMSFLVAS